MDAHLRWPAPDLLDSAPAPGSHASTTWGVATALRGTEYEVRFLIDFRLVFDWFCQYCEFLLKLPHFQYYFLLKKRPFQ